MCGFTGVYGNLDHEGGVDRIDDIKKSAKYLENRGPDYKSIYTSKNVVMAHARLSIIDTSDSANQPFKSLIVF